MHLLTYLFTHSLVCLLAHTHSHRQADTHTHIKQRGKLWLVPLIMNIYHLAVAMVILRSYVKLGEGSKFGTPVIKLCTLGCKGVSLQIRRL